MDSYRRYSVQPEVVKQEQQTKTGPKRGGGMTRREMYQQWKYMGLYDGPIPGDPDWVDNDDQ